MPRALPAVIAACLVVGLAACAAPADGDPGAVASRSTCAPQWAAPHGGLVTFQVRNADIATGEVDLIDPATGGVYGEVESLAPGTTRPLTVTLGPGTYALRCLLEDSTAVTGPSFHVADGPTDAPRAVLPVTEQDLRGAVTRYRAYVTVGLGTLVARARSLAAALRTGDRGRARTAWLAADLAYERLGAAYDTFGDLGDRIDGSPDGLPGGVNDPDFTGLRRIEYGLWHASPLMSLVAPGAVLAADARSLRAGFAAEQIDPNDLPLRAHEILENTERFVLTGAADEGSGSELPTVAANLAGTQAVLDALAPVMRPRYAAWPAVAPAMDRVRAVLAQLRRTDGSWPPLAAVAGVDRRRLDGAVGGLLETLAPIAAIGDVRRTS